MALKQKVKEKAVEEVQESKVEESPVIDSPKLEVLDVQFLIPGGRKNMVDEKIIKVDSDDELKSLSLSTKLTGYNPKTKEARIKIG
jgi:hypothetical protein